MRAFQGRRVHAWNPIVIVEFAGNVVTNDAAGAAWEFRWPGASGKKKKKTTPVLCQELRSHSRDGQGFFPAVAPSPFGFARGRWAGETILGWRGRGVFAGRRVRAGVCFALLASAGSVSREPCPNTDIKKLGKNYHAPSPSLYTVIDLALTGGGTRNSRVGWLELRPIGVLSPLVARMEARLSGSRSLICIIGNQPGVLAQRATWYFTWIVSRGSVFFQIPRLAAAQPFPAVFVLQPCSRITEISAQFKLSVHSVAGLCARFTLCSLPQGYYARNARELDGQQSAGKP